MNLVFYASGRHRMQTTPRELPAKGPERPSYVPNIPNFRDVGVTVNNWVGRK